MKTQIRKILAVCGVLAAISFASWASWASAQTSYAPLSGDKIPKKAFARILAEYLNIPAVQSTNCYRNLDPADSNTLFICALKRAKIFKPTGNFSPDSNVNWDFALTSLCRSQNWMRSKNFTACKLYAKRRNWLPSQTINRRDQITYGDLSYLMDHARGAVPSPAPSSPSPAAIPQLPPRATATTVDSPFPEQEIPRTFFSNISLSAPIPNRFYRDEVYFVEGDVTGVTTNKVFVFICRYGESCDNSTDFLENTTGAHFKIPVHFTETGNFQIGIIPGESGESRVSNVSVLPEAPFPDGGHAATSLSAAYSAGKTTFSWNGSGAFTRLIFFQGTQRRDYVFRQGINSFAPMSEDFANFTRGAVNWFVEQNNLPSAIRQILATVQEFRKVENGAVQISSMPETFSAAPVQFTFVGTTLKPVSKKAAVILPGGQVEEINFATSDLAAGQAFTINYNMASNGTYIFEINNPEGGAVVNAPIYAGSDLPLLPDFFALNPPELNTSPISNLSQARQTMLVLLNANRASNSLSPLELSDGLNSIAQGHAQNMVTRNFFRHTDPSGLSPDGRRRAAGYPVPIRENLAKSASIELAQAGLMRSPIHREAIIDPAMTRVGIGIVKNSEGYYIITQNFSATPMVASDLATSATNLFNRANTERANRGLPALTTNSTLQGLAADWSDRMANHGFFDVTDSDGTSIVNLAVSRGITSSIQINIVQASDLTQLETELSSQSSLLTSSIRKLGVGLGVNATGDLFMTTIYTP